MTYPDTALVGVRTAEILEDRFVMETAHIQRAPRPAGGRDQAIDRAL